MSGGNPDLMAPGNMQFAQAPARMADNPELPYTPTNKMHFYASSLVVCSMHRTDGKKLAFVNGFLETDDENDIIYLDNEINRHKNPYISHATEEQIDLAHMRRNPLKTMEDKLRPKIEAEMRAALEAEIRAQQEQQLTGSLDGETKIAGTDTGDALTALARLKSMSGTTGEVRSGTGTVHLGPTNTSDLGMGAKQSDGR